MFPLAQPHMPLHPSLLVPCCHHPLGSLELDVQVCAALKATGHFDALDLEADEVRCAGCAAGCGAEDLPS